MAEAIDEVCSGEVLKHANAVAHCTFEACNHHLASTTNPSKRSSSLSIRLIAQRSQDLFANSSRYSCIFQPFAMRQRCFVAIPNTPAFTTHPAFPKNRS